MSDCYVLKIKQLGGYYGTLLVANISVYCSAIIFSRFISAVIESRVLIQYVNNILF